MNNGTWEQILSNMITLQSFTLNVLGQGVLMGVNGSSRDNKVLNEASTAYQYKHDAAWDKLVKVAKIYHRDHSWKKDDNPPLPFPCWWKDNAVKEFHLSHWVASHLAAGVSAGRAGGAGSVCSSTLTDNAGHQCFVR